MVVATRNEAVIAAFETQRHAGVTMGREKSAGWPAVTKTNPPPDGKETTTHGGTIFLSAKIDPITFEAVKVGQSFGQNGYLLKLGVYPSETPGELPATPQGTRFLVVLVPLPSRDEEIGAYAVQQAAILCKDPRFWNFLRLYGYANGPVRSEGVAVEVLRSYLEIMSRAELRIVPEKRDDFLELRRHFYRWMETNDAEDANNNR